MRIVIVGAGGHASDVLELIVRAHPTWEVVGCVDAVDPGEGRLQRRGIRYLGTSGISEGAAYVIGIGYPETRRRVVRELRGGVPAPPIVDPMAVVSSTATLGDGSAVFWQAGISPLATIGAHVLISYGATIGHDSSVADYASVMPGARLSGDVMVGEAALIGTGAVVLEGRRVGAEARVGAGAVVTMDVPDGVTVVGIPALPLEC